MLPAAKVLLVTVILGGGTVGTFALAGGFGPGKGGSGNGETTAQVAAAESAKPAASVPAATTPKVTTPPEAGAARDGVQQREEVGRVDQAPQQDSLEVGGSTLASPQPEPQGNKNASSEEGQGAVAARSGSQGQPTDSQISDPVSPRNNAVDGAHEGQGATAGGKVGKADSEDTIVNNEENAPGSSVPEGKPGSETIETPGSSPSGDSHITTQTVQQENLGAGQRENGSLPASVSNPGSTGDNGVVKNTEQTITSSPADSKAGNKGDDVGSTGTDGADTITASGEDGTETA